MVVLPGLAIIWIAWRTFTGLPTNGLGFVAFVTGIVVIGQLVSTLRAFLADKPTSPIFIGVAVLPAILIILGFLLPSSGWSLLLLILGLVLAPISIAVVSETVFRTGKVYSKIFSNIWAFLIGLALLLAGSVLTAGWLSPSFPAVPMLLVAAIIAAGIFVLILLISADNVVDLLLVAVILSFIAFVEPAGPAPVEYNAAKGGNVLVALGDSYMSGEGVGDFYDGTNEKDSNECRQSEKAYAPLMTGDDLPPVARFDQVIFLACSGADAVHLASVPQFPDVEPQLTQLKSILDRNGSAANVKLVILTIGGNDAGFGTIARTCVIPGDCRDEMERVLARLPELGRYLKETYQDTRNRLADMGITAPLVVVPYPVPIDGEGCAWSSLVFDANEHKFLNDFTNQLNNAIISAAREAGVAVVEPMASAFVGDNRLAICSRVLGSNPPETKNPGDIGVNLIGVESMAGSPGQITNPQNWFHNSMHPKAEGHQAMRRVLADWLVANDGTLTDVARGSDVVIAPLPDLDVNPQGWIYASVATFLKTHLPGPFLAAVGAWLLAMRAIGWSRARRKARQPVAQAAV